LSFVKARRGFLNGNTRTFNAAFTGTNLSHSATRQQAEGFLEGETQANKEYPTILRRDVYKANTKLTPCWLKIPIYGVKGGINVPTKTHELMTWFAERLKSLGGKANGSST